MFDQMMSLGLLFFVVHLEHTTPSVSQGTGAQVSTDSPWHKGFETMYKKDKYARDRVMKSARLLLPFIKDTDTVLDVGCFTQEARKYFPRTVKYIGLDSVKYHKDTKVTDLNHGFEPISCSSALCLETLEHLVDPEDTLSSIQKSISDQGYVVVSLPNETTLFHRIRCLLGTVDYQCFVSQGKHLHLPSLKQCRKFLSQHLEIVNELYYISPSAVGSGNQWVGEILRLIPDSIHQFFADRFPSLFARGFIFLLRKPGAKTPDSHEQSHQSRPLPERPPAIDLSGKSSSDSSH